MLFHKFLILFIYLNFFRFLPAHSFATLDFSKIHVINWYMFGKKCTQILSIGKEKSHKKFILNVN